MGHHHNHERVPPTNYGVLSTDRSRMTKPTEIIKRKGELEREVYGERSIMLRNVCGVLALLTTCFIALFNAWTTYQSVINSGTWPSDIVVITVNIGPIICAWSFLSANKTIATILKGTSGMETGLTRFRRGLSMAISPDAPRDRDTDQQ